MQTACSSAALSWHCLFGVVTKVKINMHMNISDETNEYIPTKLAYLCLLSSSLFFWNPFILYFFNFLLFKYSQIAKISSTIKSKKENSLRSNAALWIGSTGVTNYALLKTQRRRRGIVEKKNSEQNPKPSSPGKSKLGKCL